MTPYRPPSNVKWYRRLDVRLSVMLVAALLVFDVFDRVEHADEVEGIVCVGQCIAVGDHSPVEAAFRAVGEAL